MDGLSNGDNVQRVTIHGNIAFVAHKQPLPQQFNVATVDTMPVSIIPIKANPQCSHALTAQLDRSMLVSLLRFNAWEVFDAARLIEILLDTLLPAKIKSGYRLDIFPLSDDGRIEAGKSLRSCELIHSTNALDPIDAVDFLISSGYYQHLKHVTLIRTPLRPVLKIVVRTKNVADLSFLYSMLQLSDELRYIIDHPVSHRHMNRSAGFRTMRNILSNDDKSKVYEVGDHVDTYIHPSSFFIYIPEVFYRSVKSFLYIAVNI